MSLKFLRPVKAPFSVLLGIPFGGLYDKAQLLVGAKILRAEDLTEVEGGPLGDGCAAVPLRGRQF